MGSAILNETLLASDRAFEGATLGISDLVGCNGASSPKMLGETEDIFRGDAIGLENDIPAVPDVSEHFRQTLEADRDTLAPKASVPLAEREWPPAPSAIPLSPGAVLLEEFDEIHQKYERRVYRQCFRMLRNQEDAEDLTQEVFLQLFRKAHTFRGEANFSTWLHRLTVNTVLMRLRRHRRWRDAVTSLDIALGSEQDVGDVLTLVSTLPAPPASTVDKISLDVAIAQLSSGYRKIFLLHDAEGYRHDEIAKMLGISEGTSKSQLHKARFKLRELIESSGGGTSAFHDESSVRNRCARKDRSCTTAAKFVLTVRHPNLVGGKTNSGSKRRQRRPSAAESQGE